MPRPLTPPSKKWSSEQSLISWACFQKVVRTNEIVILVVVMYHFPDSYSSIRIFDVISLHCHKHALAQEIGPGSFFFMIGWGLKMRLNNNYYEHNTV